MKNIFLVLTFIITQLTNSYGYYCPVDKNYYDNNEPKEFNNSNNALRSQGDVSVLSSQDIMQVRIRVLDENCVPVKDAYVKMWHRDNAGYYPYEMFRNQADHKLSKPNRQGTFQGSATCVTNNNGECTFITTTGYKEFKHIMPITFRVERSDLEELQTLKYFALTSKNNEANLEISKLSPKYKLLWPEEMPQNVPNFYRYNVDIILPASSAFKTY